MMEINGGYMSLTDDDKSIATARFSQYAAASGNDADRLVSRAWARVGRVTRHHARVVG
jgi:hypothetical protein